MGWFSLRGKRSANTAASAGLGMGLVALRLDAGDVAPPGTVVVAFGATGQGRRLAPGKVAGKGIGAADDTVFCFHPGPYTVDLAPFAAAPEWGLRVRVLVDAPNPHMEQQRFDLFLYAEHHEQGGQLSLAALGATLQTALQGELAQGALDLPPCTTLAEWHAFRAGFNQLLYTRYGLTVDDCVPVDLGGQVDFAEVLRSRALAAVAAADEAVQATQALHSMSALPQAQALHSMPALPPAEVPAAQKIEPVLQPASRSMQPPQPHHAARPGSRPDAQPESQSESHPHSESDSQLIPQPVAQATSQATTQATSQATTQATSQATMQATTEATAQATTEAKTQPVKQSALQSRIAPQPTGHAMQDAAGLRRLFLELPVLSRDLRLLALPDGAAIFQQHQSLLLRLGMASLNVDTMPSLAWTAPDRPLAGSDQARRAAATAVAVAALDEAWSLLARLQLAGSDTWTALQDEADRVCANLETGLALRRAPHAPRQEPQL